MTSRLPQRRIGSPVHMRDAVKVLIHWSWRACTVASLLALTGCAATHADFQPDLPLPAVWRNATPPESNPGGGSAHAASLSGTVEVWRVFEDRRLDELVDAALQSNLSLAVAAEHLRAARALAGVAMAPYRPTLSFGSSPSSTPDARATYFQFGFDATWELPLFSRATNAHDLLAVEVANASADAAGARSSVVGETICAYFELVTAARRDALLLRLSTFDRGRLERTRSRVSAGLESPVALQSAAMARLATEVRAVEARPAQIRSLQRLAILIGRTDPDPSWTFDAQPIALPIVSIDSTPADLLRARPDVRVAEGDVLGAAAALGIAQADIYPHVSLVGALAAATRISGLGASASNGMLSIGPAISIPLVDWGMRRARRDARSAELTAAVLGYRQCVLTAIAEGESALAQWNSAERTVQMLTGALRSSEEAHRASDVLVRAGLADESAFDSERELIEAQLSVAESQLQGVRALVQLWKAFGGAAPVAET